jgi:hypothetical protein
MKTTLITLIALVTFTTTTLTYANAKTNDNTAVVLTDVSNINKIEAHGNVEVYITNGAKDEVKVFDQYYSQNALVQGNNGTLRISSYNTDKLVVLVTVTDLRAVTAYDNASIKSYGTLSALELDVKLNDNAAAQLKIDANNANITASGRSKANLSGTIENYNLTYSHASTVNRTELVAANRTETMIAQPTHIAGAASELDVVANM